MSFQKDRRYNRKLFLLLAGTALTGPTLALVGLHFHHFSERPRIGELLPGFSIWTAGGTTQSVHEVRGGKPALLVYVKPECGFCRSEMGTLDYLDRLEGSQVKLIVVLVLSDNHEVSDAIALGNVHPKLSIFVDRSRSFWGRFGGGEVPLAVAVSSDGVIRKLDRGERTIEYFRTVLAQLQQEAKS